MSQTRLRSSSIVAFLTESLVLLSCIAGSAWAVPDPVNSECPAAVTVGTGGCCFDVVVRDFNNIPANGSAVTIGFSGCALPDAQALTNVQGVAHFCISGSLSTSCTATIFADGVALCSVPAQGCASWAADGVPVCQASRDETFPAIAPDGAGGAIVTWQDFRHGSDFNIYAQHVLASGVVDGGWPLDGRAICTALNDQRSPVIVSDNAGGAIIVWQDFRNGVDYDIYAQHILASGVVDGGLWPANGLALCTATGNQQYPMIVSDGAGGAIVTWDDFRAGNHDVYAQRVLSSGLVSWTPNGLSVCATSADQEHPTIATDEANGAIIAWEDLRAGTNYDIYAQHVKAGGVLDAAWPADGRAVCTATNNQRTPTIVSDDSSGAIVTWQDRRGGANYDVYAQRVLSYGILDVRWPAGGRALCTAAGDQTTPVLVDDGTGGAVVAWADARGGNGDVYAHHVLRPGNLDAWPANGLAVCTAAGAQGPPTIATDGAGGAIVTWSDSRNGSAADIYAQRVLSSGVVDPVWPVDGGAICTAAGLQAFPAITSDGAHGAIVAWHDYRNGADADIYAQHVGGGFFFNGVVHNGLGGSNLAVHGDTLKVTGIGGSGEDGVEVTLPEDVSAFRNRFDLPDESTLTAGAYLEVASRARGSAPGESLGFTRMTRLATSGQYAISGQIAGASQQDVAVYNAGTQVYRDRRTASAIDPEAITPRGLSNNDDLGGRAPGTESGPTPLSPLLLRWQWGAGSAIKLVNRPGGAPDTTVTGDELRILQVNPPAGNYASLSEFLIRGKDLGEIRILSEKTRTTGVRIEPPATGALWFAPPTPNPSRGRSGTFTFRLAKADVVSLELMDLAGRSVARRDPEALSAGSHVVRWEASGRPPGLYFVRLATGSGEVAVRSWILLR